MRTTSACGFAAGWAEGPIDERSASNWVVRQSIRRFPVWVVGASVAERLAAAPFAMSGTTAVAAERVAAWYAYAIRSAVTVEVESWCIHTTSVAASRFSARPIELADQSSTTVPPTSPAMISVPEIGAFHRSTSGAVICTASLSIQLDSAETEIVTGVGAVAAVASRPRTS